jgi:hypothetical protein
MVYTIMPSPFSSSLFSGFQGVRATRFNVTAVLEVRNLLSEKYGIFILSFLFSKATSK